TPVYGPVSNGIELTRGAAVPQPSGREASRRDKLPPGDSLPSSAGCWRAVAGAQGLPRLRLGPARRQPAKFLAPLPPPRLRPGRRTAPQRETPRLRLRGRWLVPPLIVSRLGTGTPVKCLTPQGFGVEEPVFSAGTPVTFLAPQHLPARKAAGV